jgi:hypothetical protein
MVVVLDQQNWVGRWGHGLVASLLSHWRIRPSRQPGMDATQTPCPLPGRAMSSFLA